MCLAVPMKVVEIDGMNATAEVGGAKYRANLTMMPETQIGDYIIVHAGFAIEKLDEKAALETLQIWQEISEYDPQKRNG